jgi:hypothetical protein
LRPTLQAVIANCRGRPHGGLNVASFEKLPLLVPGRLLCRSVGAPCVADIAASEAPLDILKE